MPVVYDKCNCVYAEQLLVKNTEDYRRCTMSKKILNLLAFLAVLAGCIAMTVFTGKGSVSTMIYNFVFLAIMTVLIWPECWAECSGLKGSDRPFTEEKRN